MSASGKSDDRERILRVLRAVNQAWLKGRFEDLDGLLREDVVFVAPGLVDRVEGRAACERSYADFATHATVHDFKESEFQVDVWGDTAVVAYRFEVGYAMKDERHRADGREVFVFVRENDEWRVAWRTMLPSSEVEEETEAGGEA